MAGLALLLLVAIGWALLVLLKLHLFAFLPTRIPDEGPPRRLPPGISYTRVPCLGGDELAVYYRSEPDPALPYVLYCHGVMTVQEYDVDFMEASLGHVNLVAYDYRGYGRSDGVSNEYSCALDVLYLLAWMKHTFPAINLSADVVLWGRSIGTNVVLQSVGLNKERQGVLPDRIVLYTPFTRLSSVLRNVRFPAPFLAHVMGNMDVVKHLRRFCAYHRRRRVLIMGTTTDTVTPYSCCLELAGAVSTEDQVLLHTFDGTHIGDFDEWDVFDKWIADTRPELVAEQVTETEILECVRAMFAEE